MITLMAYWESFCINNNLFPKSISLFCSDPLCDDVSDKLKVPFWVGLKKPSLSGQKEFFPQSQDIPWLIY
jgi:hypothetical protein